MPIDSATPARELIAYRSATQLFGTREDMRRREFVMGMGATLGRAAFVSEHAPATAGEASARADHTLRIAPTALEIAPSHFVSTIAYNGTSPGPLLRLKEGRPVTVDVVNDTDAAELVHWHGLFLPPELDGAAEEGTPLIPPGGRARYRFIPRPAGTRWYHTHAMAMGDLHRGTYTGQYGYLMVEPARDPGRYDQEVFLALRDWEPFYTDQPIDTDDQDTRGPQPERPAALDTRPNGLEPASQLFSINDKALGAGEPIRVRQGSRVLFHLLNASALENRTIALPGHAFVVLALDGNAVPTPRASKVVTLGPGERVDAYVDMNRPGVWILGSTFDPIRNAGLGVIIEYANVHRVPQWASEPGAQWDYTAFGHASSRAPARPRPITRSIWSSEKSQAALGLSIFGPSTASLTRTQASSCCTRGCATASISATAPTTPIPFICTGTSSSWS